MRRCVHTSDWYCMCRNRFLTNLHPVRLSSVFMARVARYVRWLRVSKMPPCTGTTVRPNLATSVWRQVNKSESWKRIFSLKNKSAWNTHIVVFLFFCELNTGYISGEVWTLGRTRLAVSNFHAKLMAFQRAVLISPKMLRPRAESNKSPIKRTGGEITVNTRGDVHV